MRTAPFYHTRLWVVVVIETIHLKPLYPALVAALVARYREIVKTLCNIHNEGLIHNDIKRRYGYGNICHIIMIDFALSERSADMKRAGNEMVCLKRMLRV